MNEVWFVTGDPESEEYGMPLLWRTKMDAEIYARRLFPDESPSRQYARIYYKKVLSYDEQTS